MKYFIFLVLILLSCSGFCSESWSPAFSRVEVSFDLEPDIGLVDVSAEINPHNGELLYIEARYLDHSYRVPRERLSRYGDVDLNSIRFFVEGTLIEKDKNYSGDKLEENYQYLSSGFIICIEHGEFKKAKRNTEEGYFRDSLEIKFDSSGFKISNLKVSDQELPTSACTVNQK